MSQLVFVNPDILRWARETAGYSVEEVVRKLKRKRITIETVESWENGKEFPNYIELERLAYEIYKRPLALFFFPEPPIEETPRQSFRTLPEQEIERFSPRLLFLLRQAKTMQINLDELYEHVNPAQNKIIHDLKFSSNIAFPEMVNAVREYLKIDLEVQMKWKSTTEAFRVWRKAFEEYGVFVFKEAFKEETISGFCFYDEQFPLIYINNSKSITRQIFTLFHELSHLLFRTGGIDTSLEGYVNLLKGENKRIEMFCNRFAGAFLVPDDDFNKRIKYITVNENSVSELAGLYSVSREVILRKFFDRSMVNQQYYEKIIKKWEKEAKKARDNKEKGGTFYNNKGVYLGDSYINLVFSRLYQNRISENQLADYLGIAVKKIPNMEAWLFKRGAKA